MSILLTILLSIIGLLALILILALFIEKKYSIFREVIINRPSQEVFNYIKYLKNQDNFSKWVMTDPNMKKTYTGTDGTVGFIYAWDGNKQAGKGEQEIIKIAEGERLEVEVRFIKPFEGIATTPITTIATSANQTKLTWGMNSEMKYPMNFMLPFMKKVLAKDLEISLATLKSILEK